MGRYTLMHYDGYINPYVKVSLKKIDDFTTQFGEYSDIVSHLSKKGINIRGELRIGYVSNGHDKTAKMAYEDKKDLQKIKMTSDSKIDQSNAVFNNYLNKFVIKLDNDFGFYNLVIKSSLFSDKIKEYIDEYIMKKDNFSYNKLREYLSSYSQFRKILFVFEEYEWYKKAKEVEKKKEELAENPGYDRHGFSEEFLTDEEIAEYEKYMEELPDDMTLQIVK